MKLEGNECGLIRLHGEDNELRNKEENTESGEGKGEVESACERDWVHSIEHGRRPVNSACRRKCLSGAFVIIPASIARRYEARVAQLQAL